MAGIAPAPEQAPADDQTQQQGPDEIGDEEGMAPNVSPEEQQQYDDFVLSGLALIYDEPPKGEPQDGGQPQGKGQVRPGILKLLDNDPSDLKGILNAKELDQFSPLVAIAAATVVVTVEIQKLAKGEDISDDVVLHGGAAILAELAEIWMRRNKQQLGEDDVHKALAMAADIYREVAADAGLIDENALKDQFADLVKADKEGRLAEVSPDLAGINKAAEINMEQGDDPSSEEASPDEQAAPPAEEEEEQA